MTEIARRIGFIFCAVALAVSAVPAGAAGAEDGKRLFDALAAYDGGRYGAARAIWQDLAQRGDTRAMVGLAGLYRQGLGVASDPPHAAALYGRAARAGDAVAQMNLGEMLAEGDGVSRDRVAAWAWLTLAARQGRDWAQDRADKIWAALDSAGRSAARAKLSAVSARMTQAPP